MASSQAPTNMFNRNMGFYEDFISGLNRAIDERFEGKKSRLAKAAETHTSTLSRLLDKERSQWLNQIARLADSAGLTLIDQGESPSPRDVCWVDAKVVAAGSGLPSPDHEDYYAVPLVDEAGAGPGIIPQGQLISWFLVWRHQETIRHRADLIAVRIAKGSDSMAPTLAPGDIVLVDRQDKNADRPGRIMLVMDPDGAGKVKRVHAQHLSEEKDYRLTYYSDNAASYPPEVYSLKRDFEGDWHRAIVGRVIWAWSDVSGK